MSSMSLFIQSSYYFYLQVREMVEIITREFIQMAGSAGEVTAVFHIRETQ